jgi:uncharacterized protein (TIGR03083 family)
LDGCVRIQFSKVQARGIAAERGTGGADTLKSFNGAIELTSHPPGPTPSWLGEVIVHGQDIRQPLGIAHDYPEDALVTVADFYKRSNLILGAKRRITDLQLNATDVNWSTGTGPEVRGPILSVVMAMVGRYSGAADLTGEGLAVLRSRP